jgi:CO/xanthine dehydrogenase Mo-binding subunit
LPSGTSPADGRPAPDGILGRQARILLNSGAYAENSPLVGRKAANRLGGPYRIPALEVTCSVVYTNTAPASSFRGFGAPQVIFASESQMDEAAERLGLDPLELRLRNVLELRERPWPKVRGLDADLAADMRLAAEQLDWDAPAEPGRGKAICISASDAGSEPVTTSVLRVHPDGSVTVMAGSTEIGQGSATVLAQIAAGEMGVPLDRVHLYQSDTAAVSYDRSTGASRTTTLISSSSGPRSRWPPMAPRSSRSTTGFGSATRSTTGERSSGHGSPGRAARSWAAGTCAAPGGPRRCPRSGRSAASAPR